MVVKIYCYKSIVVIIIYEFKLEISFLCHNKGGNQFDILSFLKQLPPLVSMFLKWSTVFQNELTCTTVSLYSLPEINVGVSSKILSGWIGMV